MRCMASHFLFSLIFQKILTQKTGLLSVPKQVRSIPVRHRVMYLFFNIEKAIAFKSDFELVAIKFSS